ncbi:MAG: SDR family NAD(P)-dependent oxidoreductase [Bacteroidota bacterium]|nr:SDR family NAD(P)-dependent oxidoreductase [Bacteroidota bacterium]
MNKIVLITGATSGIGLACAHKYAAAGDHLILTGRRKDRLNEIEEELIQAHGIRVRTLHFDVRDKDAVRTAIASLEGNWKQVDILINNAGLALGRDYFEEASMDDWETMIHTNISGLLYVTREILPFMIERKKGHIINLGSVAGDDVYERGNVYCGTKFAVGAISRSMRIDLLRHGIKVTNIKPGAVETEFSIVRFHGDKQSADKVYEGFTPLSGADIADTIYYCTSLPAHVCINDLDITPLAQANGIYLHRGPVQ